ncbi:MAG: hypothetical protein JNJ83_11620 [Verrucomicrobiaceae bacterium]|nr:hypothetical protein [Verrucomicrobiaceae bacterium]
MKKMSTFLATVALAITSSSALAQFGYGPDPSLAAPMVDQAETLSHRSGFLTVRDGFFFNLRELHSL